MNKIQFSILKCCYKNVCASDDIKILLKLTQVQFITAVEKLVTGRYLTQSLGNLAITATGKLYVEVVNARLN